MDCAPDSSAIPQPESLAPNRDFHLYLIGETQRAVERLADLKRLQGIASSKHLTDDGAMIWYVEKPTPEQLAELNP